MATLAAGASTTLSLTPGDKIALEGIGNPVATLTLPNGRVVSVTLQGYPKQLGPFDMVGSATLAASGGDLVYSFVDYETQQQPAPGGSTTPAAGSVTAEMLAPSLAGQIAVTLPGTYSTDAARRAAVEADGRPDGTLYLVDDGA